LVAERRRRSGLHHPARPAALREEPAAELVQQVRINLQIPDGRQKQTGLRRLEGLGSRDLVDSHRKLGKLVDNVVRPDAVADAAQVVSSTGKKVFRVFKKKIESSHRHF